MSHSRRNAAVLALVLVLATTPLVATPGHTSSAALAQQVHTASVPKLTWPELATEKARRIIEIVRQFLPQTGPGMDGNGG